MPDIPDAEFIKRYGADKETVLAHELGYALLKQWGMTGEIKGPGYAELRAELREISRQFRAHAWEAAPRHVVKSNDGRINRGLKPLRLRPPPPAP